MECNKEEAFHAKELAEKKMQTKDFVSARKMALRAQQLYADLENISQMIMVCDVHCASEKKVAGNEMDWYEILQVQLTADETMIKKQYRKFALLLHPDKNKFPGAESAFKLIGEAQRVLLDKDKRHLHDMKRKAFVGRTAPPYCPPQRPPYRPPYSQNIGVQSRSNPTGFNSTGQPRPSNGRATFWTVCPYCNVKYEYYVQVMNKSLICQTCTKPFVAYERSVQGASTAASSTQPSFSQRKDVPSQGFTKVELTRPSKPSTDHKRPEEKRKVGKTELGSQKVNGKRRRKKDEESSESCDSESSSEDDDFTAAVNPTSNGERPRRSDRRRQRVSYTENESDDEDFPQKDKESGSFGASREEGINGFDANKDSGNAKNVKGKERAEDECKESSGASNGLGSNSSSKVESERELYEYAEPDFNDFQELHNKGCFRAGQVWAIYDTLGAMPRFYAQIRKVFSSAQFKVQLTWLEPDPNSEDEREWVKNGLPVSCGQFKEGETQTAKDQLMFSHNISCERSAQTGAYKVFPKKGETWAIFKNWSLEWKSQKPSFEKFEYEFVEVLSDYIDGVGVSVAYLGKLKGFVSVFCRISKEGNHEFQIPHSELFRFSHMVPSFNLTDKEKQGVPIGSFELDPASLSPNIKEVDLEAGKMKPETEPQDMEPEVEIVSDDENAPPEPIEIPEAEFFDFDTQKSIDKFDVGQIWALYSDEDGLPKYYAEITKVGSALEGFKVRLRWLSSTGLPNIVIPWTDKKMPVCCGNYVPKRGGKTYTSKDSFSHQLSFDITDKKNEFLIMPKKGQIWALYRNWRAEMKLSELKNCEYDVVEVLEENGFLIEVVYLEQVKGFNSVFKPQINEGSVVTKELLMVELFRFSHQIPAYKLTDERDGTLRGFWEIDPAALPVYYFSR